MKRSSDGLSGYHRLLSDTALNGTESPNLSGTSFESPMQQLHGGTYQNQSCPSRIWQVFEQGKAA